MKIAIFLLNWTGDVVMATPALRRAEAIWSSGPFDRRGATLRVGCFGGHQIVRELTVDQVYAEVLKQFYGEDQSNAA